ncbi:PPOX class F420-dependent oxidoreductase [Halostella litorea]|uniref:PPOX class F420-dependent oxidoreductase n=1 Tax=Halostella litorea TaxID=2528831 RepID=UPI0010926BF3|nr:PPOX class F420-dependent oxidoreductase [Halostella litorea]
MVEIPASHRDLFEKETFAHFVTQEDDATPHVTPVWVDYDADAGELLVNTARGRRKERNVRDNGTVALSMLDPDDPYRYLSVTGTVEEVTTEGAVEHIDRLAERYMGVDEYPNHGEESGERVIIRIRPDEVRTGGE